MRMRKKKNLIPRMALKAKAPGNAAVKPVSDQASRAPTIRPLQITGGRGASISTMKTKLNIRQITFAALVGALYVTLCYFSNIFGKSPRGVSKYAVKGS